MDMRRRAHARDGSAVRESTVTSPFGYFTVRVQGRAVTGVTGDTRLIETAGREQLRRDALAVFRAAQRPHGR